MDIEGLTGYVYTTPWTTKCAEENAFASHVQPCTTQSIITDCRNESSIKGRELKVHVQDGKYTTAFKLFRWKIGKCRCSWNGVAGGLYKNVLVVQ